MTDPTLIIGGPGCGKTTKLLSIVEQALKDGVEPHKIAFVAFTRKAAQEARDRMAQRFDIAASDIPYFATLHSFAFKRLGVTPDMMLTAERFAEYAKAEHLDFNATRFDEFGAIISTPSTRDEKAYAAIQLARIRRCDIDDLELDEDVSTTYCEELRKQIEEFKDHTILIDYTDLIEDFIEAGDCPSFDVLIVDEAQDLSQLQWRMVDKIAENSSDVYFAGDDDQAIYEWAGADLPHFLSIRGNKIVLPTSYRLRSNIFSACQRIIGRVDARYEKDWKPHADGGDVRVLQRLDDLDLSTGSWFFLARTSFHVRTFIKFLREEGWPYEDASGAATDNDYVRGVVTWERLRLGKTVPSSEARALWPLISPSHKTGGTPVMDDDAWVDMADMERLGVHGKTEWFDALMVPRDVERYVRAVKQRGESLFDKPRILASTIHGVKGGEADNVVLKTDVTPRVNRAMEADNGDTEHRVWFTAVSRTKNNLFLLESRSKRSYEIPGGMND